jgi:hypothetical protein
MSKNVCNTALDIKTFGSANNGVNGEIIIRLHSGGDPTMGAYVGTMTFNIDGSDRHIINRSSLGIGTVVTGAYSLNVNGTSYLNGATKISAATIINAATTINGTLISSGNVWIVTAVANNMLQVGNAGRLKLGTWIGTTDYSLIGTLDSDNALNTQIVVSGNTRPSGAGNIEYYSTNNWNPYIFYNWYEYWKPENAYKSFW